jgi:glc operon protein GlcG
MPTDEFHEQAHQRFGPDGAAMLTAAVEGTMLLGGGVPVVVEEHVVGAVGISGGRGEQDREIASAAISRVVERFRWQRGQKWLERFMNRSRTIAVPQRLHG